MRKIIFEQTLNMLMIVVLTIAVCQFTYTAITKISEETVYFEFQFGYFLLYFLLVALITFLRFFYSRKFGNKDGYSMKKGEFSAEDEREAVISQKAASTAYRVIFLTVPFFMMSLLIIRVFANINEIVAITVGIAFLGAVLLLQCGVYLLAWLILDSRV